MDSCGNNRGVTSEWMNSHPRDRLRLRGPISSRSKIISTIDQALSSNAALLTRKQRIPLLFEDNCLHSQFMPFPLPESTVTVGDFGGAEENREFSAAMRRSGRERGAGSGTVALRYLVALVANGLGDSLRVVLVSGEKLLRADWATAVEALGRHVFLVNQYGPTECTMTSTYYRIENPPLPTHHPHWPAHSQRRALYPR